MPAILQCVNPVPDSGKVSGVPDFIKRGLYCVNGDLLTRFKFKFLHDDPVLRTPVSFDADGVDKEGPGIFRFALVLCFRHGTCLEKQVEDNKCSPGKIHAYFRHRENGEIILMSEITSAKYKTLLPDLFHCGMILKTF